MLTDVESRAQIRARDQDELTYYCTVVVIIQVKWPVVSNLFFFISCIKIVSQFKFSIHEHTVCVYELVCKWHGW